MSLFSRTDQSFLSEWWWTIDRYAMGAILILMVIGVAMVATASHPVAEHLGLNSYHFLMRHLVFLVPSIALLIGFSMLGRRMIWRAATLLFVLGIGAMIAVLVAGAEIKGAQRWIRVLGFSLQPSEFIKPAFILVAAWFMALQKEREEFPGNALAVGLYTLVVGLLLLQPDLGMTIVLTCGWLTQIFLAGVPLRLMVMLGGVGLLGIVGAYFTLPHVQSRIDRFFDPQSGDNFQVERSLSAFEQGGWIGKGPGQGSVKYSLPDAHADFIFSVIGEEMGLLFVGIVIALFAFVAIRACLRVKDCDDMFVVLASGGLIMLFTAQALVHMGSAVNLIPAKGMTLPFISYGGTSLLAMSLSMGCLLALTRLRRGTGISKAGLSLFSYRMQSHTKDEKAVSS